MKKEPLIHVMYILECIEMIEKYSSKMDKENFLQNSQVQDAIMRRVEIIGEAMNNIPKEIQIQYPNVEWKDIIGMRNILIHNYLGISIEKVWKIVEKDLPTFKKQMLKIKIDLERS